MNTLLMGAVGMAVAGVTPDPDEPAAAGRRLQVFPFFHIGGLSGLYVTTVIGNKLVTMYKWDVDVAIDLLVEERITSTAMVPTVLRQLLESPRAGGSPRDALAGIASGGAPVPPDLIRRIETQFESKVSPANGYGLTETTSAVIVNSGADYFAHPDSVGRPTVGTDVRIVDEPTATTCPTGDRRGVGARAEHRGRLLEQARGDGGGVHGRLVPHRRPRPPGRRRASCTSSTG